MYTSSHFTSPNARGVHLVYMQSTCSSMYSVFIDEINEDATFLELQADRELSCGASTLLSSHDIMSNLLNNESTLTLIQQTLAQQIQLETYRCTCNANVFS